MTKGWLSKILDKILRGEVLDLSEPSSPLVPSYELERFTHEGYDIEVRIYSSRDVHLSAFLKGQCCLDGWLTPEEEWTWNALSTSNHIPSYRIRVYLKQYAQERINKE